MDSIEDYSKYIIKYAPLLTEKGFSFFGEDVDSMKFTDGEIFVTFSVEPTSDSLDVWVEFLSDEVPDETLYRLDFIMRVFYEREIDEMFKAATENQKEELVKNYIQFIADNKEKLFGDAFPMTNEYQEFQRQQHQKLFRSL